MKKLLVILMVLAFVAPAMAADNLSIKGQYYVSGWGGENFKDLDSDNKADNLSYWTQRMRIQPQIKVADGVTANLRFDFAEYDWGGTGDGTYRPTAGTDQQFQVDRAFVDIDKGIIDIKVGQQFFSVGQAQVFRDNNAGFLFTLKTPVTVKAGYVKVAENGNTDESDLNAEDLDRYMLSVGFKSDAFSIEGFYAMQADGQDAAVGNPKDEPNVFGVYASSKIGPVNIKGELAFFGGKTDDSVTETDYVGTQFNGEGWMKMSDALTLGVELIYSTGTKENNEIKRAYIGDPFARKSISTGGAVFGDYYDGNWKPSTGTPLGTDDVFDPLDGNTGALGGGVAVQFKPMADLTLTAYVHYLAAAEDLDASFDNGLLYQAVISYMLAPNTMLQAAYLGADVNITDNADGSSNNADAANAMWLNLTVNF